MKQPSKVQRVWGITRGSYSDYRVLAIFEDQAEAKAFCAAHQNTAHDSPWGAPDDVECFMFYPKGVQPVLNTVHSRSVVVWDSGDTEEAMERGRVEWEYSPLYDRVSARPNVRFVRAPMYHNKGGRLEVEGLDQQAVNQAYGDNLARLRVAAETIGKATL